MRVYENSVRHPVLPGCRPVATLILGARRGESGASLESVVVLGFHRFGVADFAASRHESFEQPGAQGGDTRMREGLYFVVGSMVAALVLLVAVVALQ